MVWWRKNYLWITTTTTNCHSIRMEMLPYTSQWQRLKSTIILVTFRPSKTWYFTWYLLGIYLVFTWFLLGFYLVFTLFLLGIHLVLLILLGIYVVFAWYALGIFLSNTWYFFHWLSILLGICLVFYLEFRQIFFNRAIIFCWIWGDFNLQINVEFSTFYLIAERFSSEMFVVTFNQCQMIIID